MVSMLVRHEPASAALARREVAGDLRARTVPQECIDDVVLVVTELLGNAIVHSVSDDAGLTVAWDVAENGVTVRVDDPSVEQPQPRHAQQHAPDGRGLAIVAAVAAEWGVIVATGGKQVWARVPLERGALHRQTA